MAKSESLPFSVVTFKRSTDKESFDSLGDSIVSLQKEIESREEKVKELKEAMKKIAERNNLPEAFYSEVWRYNNVTSVRASINKIKLLEAGVKATVIEKCTDHSVSQYIRISSNQKKEK